MSSYDNFKFTANSRIKQSNQLLCLKVALYCYTLYLLKVVLLVPFYSISPRCLDTRISTRKTARMTRMNPPGRDVVMKRRRKRKGTHSFQRRRGGGGRGKNYCIHTTSCQVTCCVASTVAKLLIYALKKNK